ncbi:MAG: hypothetical protein M3209_10850 [Acidobacteriota bacterium]|nr:hypothetical protein [Acidobacteriota bacterium]
MKGKKLIQVFNPSLAALLFAAEKDKGSPLTEDEVIAIRNSATVMMVSEESAAEFEKKRGYKDIDADNCWEEWRKLRERL